MGSTASSYVSVITATTFAQPSFVEYMQLATLPNANDLIGAVSGAYFAGGMVGAIVTSEATDYLGRRISIFISCLIACIGGALQAGSVNMGMFIAARLLSGLGIGGLFTSIPVYCSEISPPKTRGLIVGLHGIFIALGTVLCNFIGLGFYFVNAGGAQWRPPLAIQCFFLITLGCGIWFLPESPRWLVNKGRHDQALQVLLRLHRDHNDPDHIFAHQEYRQIQEQHEEDENNKATWSQMWTVTSYRRRCFLSILVMFGSQMTAILIASIYNPLLLSGLGYGIVMQLVLTGVWSLVAVVGNTLCAFTVDRLGRVLAFKLGWIFSGIGVIGICASLSIYRITGSRSAGIAGVFFLYWHIFSYAVFVDPTTYIYCAEIYPNNIRGKGMAIAIASYFAVLLLQLTSAPSAYAKLGWKLLIIYFAALVVITPLLWFFLPETKGKSLEEIGLIFGDRNTHINLDAVETTNVENDKEEVNISKVDIQ
ncbi:general substrate transporter [Exophiala viscosa]|uniref:General substrate transporter n=1 Tax=Exophiala viscosa TaxID=2486360 RepID=A0AAN6IGN8_9EURO|nr:general substrate transporter [Exophiala viscosa]